MSGCQVHKFGMGEQLLISLFGSLEKKSYLCITIMGEGSVGGSGQVVPQRVYSNLLYIFI